MMVWTQADQDRENQRFARQAGVTLNDPSATQRANEAEIQRALEANRAMQEAARQRAEAAAARPPSDFELESRVSAGEGPGLPVGTVWTGSELIPPPDPSPGDPPPGDPPPTPPPSGPSWAELMEQQRREAEAARQRLEREYASRRDELRAQYQFAETEQERAQLAFLMAELDKATQRADQAIVAGYAFAVESIGNLQAGGLAATDQETQAIQNIFLAAGSQYGDMAEDVRGRVGLQAGIAGDAYDPIDDFYSLLAADQAREAAMTQRMGGVVADEMTDAERRMAFQQASQQADLQRESAASGAQTRADQQAAVAARIAADRRDFTNNLRQLQTTYATLGASFDQAGIASYGEQAALAASESMMREQLAAQERMSNASIAARLREMEAQWAREDSQRPEWQTPELAQALLQWDLLPDTMKNIENYNRIIGPHLGTVPRAALPGRPDPSLDAPRTPSPPPPPPLVDIPDADLQRERERRDAMRFETEARALYDRMLQVYRQGFYETERGTYPMPNPQNRSPEERALQFVQNQYPGWQP